MDINTILKNYKNEKLGRFAPQFFIFIVVPNCSNLHKLINFWKNKTQKYFLDNSKTRTKKYFWNRVPKTPSTNKFWRFLNKKSKTKAILICEIGVLTSKLELVWILLIGPVKKYNEYWRSISMKSNSFMQLKSFLNKKLKLLKMVILNKKSNFLNTINIRYFEKTPFSADPCLLGLWSFEFPSIF